MFFSSSMRTAVLQATAIFIFDLILNHHLHGDMFDQVKQDEGFQNLTNAWNATITPPPPRYSARPRLALDPATNMTLTKNITGPISGRPLNVTLGGLEEQPEHFYRKVLPTDVFVNMIIFALQYWWHIGLERMFPSRPRNKEIPIQLREKFEESEDREEEVVKKWIAQGRVRRSSLSWCNTFMKWGLELTVGRLWQHTVGFIVRALIAWKYPESFFGEWSEHFLVNYIAALVAAAPLIELISFIVVPAHKRIVFVTAADMVATLFVMTVVRTFANWAVKTNFVQTAMRNMTDSTLEGLRQEQRLAFLDDWDAMAADWDYDEL